MSSCLFGALTLAIETPFSSVCYDVHYICLSLTGNHHNHVFNHFDPENELEELLRATLLAFGPWRGDC